MSSFAAERKAPDLQAFDRVITVQHLCAGQSGPYRDAYYESLITFTGKNNSTKPAQFCYVLGSKPPEAHVKYLAKMLVHEFVDEPKHALDQQLVKCECIEEGPGYSVWRVGVKVPYCD